MLISIKFSCITLYYQQQLVVYINCWTANLRPTDHNVEIRNQGIFEQAKLEHFTVSASISPWHPN